MSEMYVASIVLNCSAMRLELLVLRCKRFNVAANVSNPITPQLPEIL